MYVAPYGINERSARKGAIRQELDIRRARKERERSRAARTRQYQDEFC